ncbi:Helix-turn-helix domain-containing protein [Clostridium sp. USBA 49]|nr:Helix-turn-helix domain-containing protein [Clostridium sp. USBA 49]
MIYLNKGLIKLNWDEIDNFTTEDITYFLFLEGKSIDAISKIRNIDKEEIKRHIIEGKIKYRFLAKSKDIQELFKILCNLGKQDKLYALKYLDEKNIKNLTSYIKNNYTSMVSKEKESAIWILGELKSIDNLDILKKAMVHKHVNVRRMAVSAMGKIGDTSLEVPLIRALDDENSQVVLYAIKSLNKIKSKKAIDKIKFIYENTSKEYLKKAAEEYLCNI